MRAPVRLPPATTAPHQLLRRNRRSPAPRVQPLELVVQLPQRRIGHLPNRTHWMVIRYPLFKADVAEYYFLVVVVSTHHQ